MLTSAALGFGGCGKEPVEAVYGPPPDYYDEVEPAEPQGDTEYDPSSEEIEDVYGPPIEELDSVIDSTRTEPEPVSAKPSGK